VNSLIPFIDDKMVDTARNRGAVDGLYMYILWLLNRRNSITKRARDSSAGTKAYSGIGTYIICAVRIRRVPKSCGYLRA